MSTRKVCYYEVLGLADRKCDAAEIKTAYRKLALKMHPDKAHQNNLSVEEATQRFQKIQEAHSVLSDPQERAWYDSHREQILRVRGDDEPGEDPFKTRINLYKYFSSSCYDGFGEGAGSFFGVYADLFASIDKEEEEWEDADEDHTRMPFFGDSSSSWADVNAFYKRWSDFCSRKAFGHADKWNPRDADNRQVRRAMEQENKKERQAAKKEFNAEVRQLVSFVKKRDPRVAAHQKQLVKENAEKARREAEEKERKKAAETKQRQERKDAQRREEEERWKEVQAVKEARRARGEAVTDDEASTSSEVQQAFVCDACRKTFKSEKAFDQHAKSKKHLQMVAQLRAQMEQKVESEDKSAEESSDEEEADAEANSPAAVSHAFCPPSRVRTSNGDVKSGDSSGEESKDEDEDAFLARFAAARGGGRGGGANGKSAEPMADESSSEESSSERKPEADAKAEAGRGKKAEKRARQQAILLEKSRQREQVQELVRNCKRASGDGDAADQSEAPADPESISKSPASAAGAGANRCGVCNEGFPSRSKLFQHIKVSGHAVLKEAPPDSAASKAAKRKGKR